MKQQEVFNKIGGIIKELNEQYKYLEADPGKINELELELFVANTHFLTHNAEVLRKINVQDSMAKPAEQPAAKSEEKYFEPLVHEPEAEPIKGEIIPVAEEITAAVSNDGPVPHIDIASAAPTDEYSYIREEPEIIRHELEIDESWADDEDEIVDEPEKNESNKETERPKFISARSIAKKPEAAKPDEEVVTINQKISAQLGNKAAPELSQQPISDLKSAITLNDKLLYVKDLFNGYSLAYSEAIEILNRFKTFEEADNYLKSNYAIKNNWEDKAATSEKFYAVLRRRFS